MRTNNTGTLSQVNIINSHTVKLKAGQPLYFH
uniref:Uncharacterized protein n=1 Tax=Rhizophora mucronata TaxID=61149 RepID=A0A2P2PBV9_RHIMU